jgi:hypothetical protein
MKGYYIKRDGKLITLAKLTEAGVSFSKFELGRENGVLIPDDANLDKILNALGLEIKEGTPTNYKDILCISLRKKKKTDDGQNSEDKKSDNSPPEKLQIKMPKAQEAKKFKQATRELLSPIFEEGVIEIILAQGKTLDYQKLGDANFFIILYGASRKTPAKATPPAKLWGIEVQNRSSAYYSSGEGASITDPDNQEYEVAELINRRFLYIHHDACSFGTQSEIDLYRRILEAAVWELTIPEEEKRQKKFSSQKQNFLKTCSHNYHNEISKLEKEDRQGDETIASLQQQFYLAIKIQEEKKLRLNSIKTNETAYYKTKFEAQFEDIAKMQKVKSVNIDQERKKLVIFTDTLFCKHPHKNQIHEIGRFMIEIDISGDRGLANKDNCFGLRWYNLTRRVDTAQSDMNAPHVSSGGRACLGTAVRYLPELLANAEYSAIADLTIQFVESVDLDDGWGKYLESWPIAKKSKIKKDKKHLE